MKNVTLTVSIPQADLIRARRFARESGLNLSLDETVSLAIGRLNDKHVQPPIAGTRKGKPTSPRSRKRHPGKRAYTVWLRPEVRKAASDRARFSGMSIDDYVGAMIRINNPDVFPETRFLATMPEAPAPEPWGVLPIDMPPALAEKIAAIAARENRTVEDQVLVFLKQVAAFDETFKRHAVPDDDAGFDFDAVERAVFGGDSSGNHGTSPALPRPKTETILEIDADVLAHAQALAKAEVEGLDELMNDALRAYVQKLKRGKKQRSHTEEAVVSLIRLAPREGKAAA